MFLLVEFHLEEKAGFHICRRLDFGIRQPKWGFCATENVIEKNGNFISNRYIIWENFPENAINDWKTVFSPISSDFLWILQPLFLATFRPKMINFSVKILHEHRTHMTLLPWIHQTKGCNVGAPLHSRRNKLSLGCSTCKRNIYTVRSLAFICELELVEKRESPHTTPLCQKNATKTQENVSNVEPFVWRHRQKRKWPYTTLRCLKDAREKQKFTHCLLNFA